MLHPTPAARRAGAHRRVAGAIVCALLVSAMAPTAAYADPCVGDAVRQAAENGRNREQTRASVEAAASKEALDASLRCLENIMRALNGMIPGVSVNLNIAGIISGMINRACQVVTTRIDTAGQTINGTVSGATNRVIGGVNDAVPVPVVSGGTRAGATSTAVESVQTSPNGNVSVTAPSPTGSFGSDIWCRLRGTCRN
jgi:hypothetical protein